MAIYVTDTHALVFFANRNQRALSRRAWEIFEQAENRQALILIPAAALWEVSNLERIGRINLTQPYEEWTRQLFSHPCFDCVPLDAAIIAEARHCNINDEEIIERTQYALINEGAKILEEGIALRAVDIDIIYISGYGYPAWRGGPMWYADTVGLKKVYDRVQQFYEEHGEVWTPAPLLKELAETGKTFAKFDQAKSAT